MKQTHIAGKLLKCLLLAGLLSACNHDDAVKPQDTIGTTINNENAKLSPAFKLIKSGADVVHYAKAGKFVGLVTKVDGTSSYKLYTYDDSNGSNKLLIKSTNYSKSTNQQIGVMTFEVLNGRCTKAFDANGISYEYKYNGAGLLEETKLTYQAQTASWMYTYQFNAATGTQRLYKTLSQKLCK